VNLLAVAIAGRGLVDPAQPVFGAGDEALLRGSAAFETLPVYGGRPFLLDRHLVRLRRSAEGLGLEQDAGAAVELAALVAGAVGADHVMRLYVTSETVVAIAEALPGDLEERRREGIRLRSIDIGDPPSLLAGVKATSYALPFAARREAERHGDDDALLVAHGRVLDAVTANLWWRTGEMLYTPSPGPGVLPGVTRELVLELAAEDGVTVQEGAFPLRAVTGADEAFTTSSIREVLPVVALDGLTIGGGVPGPAAARLQGSIRLRSRA
jgi:branched-subunit amino acid aminotransferase/4-amino-4-deoxychorismate lyase